MRTFRVLVLAALATGSLALDGAGSGRNRARGEQDEVLQGGRGNQRRSRNRPDEGRKHRQGGVLAAQGGQVGAGERQEPRS